MTSYASGLIAKQRRDRERAVEMLPPSDVEQWLSDHYSDEGEDIWLQIYQGASTDHKALMIRIARISEGGQEAS